MILKLLLNTQMICMMFVNILKNTIKISNENTFDDISADMVSNKMIQQTVIE